MAAAAGRIDRYISYGRYLPDLPENGVSNAVACRKRICALRAPTVFLVRKRTIRTKNTVMDKATMAWDCFYPRSSIARGCVSHPCAIDDPRGRLLVRATSQLCNSGARDLVLT